MLEENILFRIAAYLIMGSVFLLAVVVLIGLVCYPFTRTWREGLFRGGFFSRD